MTMIDPVAESVPADLKALGGGGLKKLFGRGPSDGELKTSFLTAYAQARGLGESVRGSAFELPPPLYSRFPARAEDVARGTSDYGPVEIAMVETEWQDFYSRNETEGRCTTVFLPVSGVDPAWDFTIGRHEAVAAFGDWEVLRDRSRLRADDWCDIFVPFGVDDVSPYQPVIDAVAPWLATSLGTSVSVRGGAIWAVGAELRYKRTSLDTLWGLAFTAAAALSGHDVTRPQTTPMQPREPGSLGDPFRLVDPSLTAWATGRGLHPYAMGTMLDRGHTNHAHGARTYMSGLAYGQVDGRPMALGHRLSSADRNVAAGARYESTHQSERTAAAVEVSVAGFEFIRLRPRSELYLGEDLTFGDNDRREVESIPALDDRYRVYCGLNDSDAAVAAVLSDNVAGELASSLAIADYEIRGGVLVAEDRSVLKAAPELEALWHSMAWLSRALQ